MLLREALPLSDRLLCVSGARRLRSCRRRCSREFRWSRVSAPSSLAIELAQASGVTLVGFVRGDGFNIYAHPGRIF
jgi:FdhD protein